MWTKQQVRQARKIELPPLLRQRNYRLDPISDENYRITPDTGEKSMHVTLPRHGTGIIVKHNFWIWHEKDISGNTIDFFVKIEGLSFNQAMQIIMDEYSYAQK